MATSPAPATRRERRAAARAAAVPRRHRRPARTSRSRAPSLATLTSVAVIVGLALVVVAALTAPQRPAPDLEGLRRPVAAYPATLADERTLGSADAPVTLEVWSDFQCPVCGRFAESVEPELVRRYVEPGSLRIVHRDAAILGTGGPGDESVLAAVAARAAARQDAYWPYHGWLFANQDGENDGAFARDRLVALAAAAGLDTVAFEAALDDPSLRLAVVDETTVARGDGIDSTPTLVLGGERIVGLRSVDELATRIDALLP